MCNNFRHQHVPLFENLTSDLYNYILEKIVIYIMEVHLYDNSTDTFHVTIENTSVMA